MANGFRVLIGCAIAATSSLPRAAHADDTVVADLGLHVVGVGYQRSVAPRLALQVDLDLYTPWTQNVNLFGNSDRYDGSDDTGGVVRLRPMIYLQPHAEGLPRGWWVSPFVQAGVVKATVADGTSERGFAWAMGGSAGYSLALGHHWALALGLGAQYHAAYVGDTTPPSFARFYPHLDGTVNWTL